MAELGICGACKTTVSLEAQHCPKCGQPAPFGIQKKGMSKALKFFGIASIAVWVLGFAACTVMCHRATDPSAIKEREDEKVAAMSPEEKVLYERFGTKPKPNKSLVASYLAAIARDPESVKVENCESAGSNKDGWLLKCQYRMKNGFGGMVSETKFFVVNHDRVMRHF